jgi:hypothetical protein
VRAFLENLKRGSPWHEAGIASAGNGAVMRIAPVVVPHLRRPSPGLWADTALCGMITHNDSASLASCVALVRMIWSILSFERPPDPMWWPESFVATARELETGAAYRPRGRDFLDYSGPLSGFVERYVPPAFEEGLSVWDACDRWYSGAFLLETMPSVLYILMKHGDDFEAALLRAVNDTKDNDTIAAIVGAVLGALHGKQAIPKRWLDGLVGRTGASDDGRVLELIDAAKAVWWDASPAETKAAPKEENSIFPGFLDLVAEVHDRSPLAGSAAHGGHHWRLVAWTGHTLMQQLRGVDPLVVLLFALFHDSQRESEYGDPGHGRRGADLARELLTMPRWKIDGYQLDLLVLACELHTGSGPTSDATLGVCWDSDRLNLWRVGTKPDAGYLSTATARAPERIEWAREVQRKDFTWTEIHEAYSALP